MRIGAKLRSGRIAAGMTQEQAAAALGVSRQTMSNWENERTYPDIVSVVRMSGLYRISLDRLLKEEMPVSDYLDFLEESTNTVRSRRRLTLAALLTAYVCVWAVSVGVFWLLSSGSDALGYSLVYLWILLPVTTFAVSLLVGRGGFWGRRKWLSALGFGAMYMLAEYATFSAANMAAFHKVNPPRLSLLAAGGVISLAGLGLGTLLARAGRRKKTGGSP